MLPGAKSEACSFAENVMLDTLKAESRKGVGYEEHPARGWWLCRTCHDWHRGDVHGRVPATAANYLAHPSTPKVPHTPGNAPLDDVMDEHYRKNPMKPYDGEERRRAERRAEQKGFPVPGVYHPMPPKGSFQPAAVHTLHWKSIVQDRRCGPNELLALDAKGRIVAKITNLEE